MISETKIDESFPLGQFKVNGLNAPFRLDRSSNGAGIMLLCLWNTSSRRYLCGSCSYNPNKSIICQHMEALAKNIDLYSSTYENFIW